MADSFEELEREGRVFRIVANQDVPRLQVLVREGDRFQQIYEPKLDTPNSLDELLTKGRNLIAGFCHKEGRPTLKFRCDKSGVLCDLKISPNGTAQEIWDIKADAPCSLCGGRHRIFVR
jgi:hypothetical protein